MTERDLTDAVKTDIKTLLSTIEITTELDIVGTCHCHEDMDNCQCKYMQLTVACNDDGTLFSWQTGDNSYTGGAYGLEHWAVVSLSHECDRAAIADDVLDQLADLLNS